MTNGFRATLLTGACLAASVWGGCAGDDGVKDPGGAAVAAAPGGPHDPCPALELPAQPFRPGGQGVSLGALAADITIETWGGPWTLESAWSGCEVYLFIQDQPRQNEGAPVPLFSRDVDGLLRKSPPNVHYFFMSVLPDEVARNQSLLTLRERLVAALRGLPEHARQGWLERVHFSPVRASEQPGWLGAHMAGPGWGVAVDRFQRLRYIGSYADGERYNSRMGWFEPNLSFAAHEAIYYNFEAERQQRLDAQAAAGVVVVPALDNEPVATGWGSDKHVFAVELPDAAAMAEFDTLELDLRAGCGGEGERGVCPAWDRIVTLLLCDPPEDAAVDSAAVAATCNTELGRWITTYHREGRWVHDVSPLLPLLRTGGRKVLAVTTVDRWYLSLSLRFSDAGLAQRPRAASFVFGGGAFGLTYNQEHAAPAVIPIADDAARVELVLTLSGHGMVGALNCAEFCDVEHVFTVNGVQHTVRTPDAGSPDACLRSVGTGTVPNQYGTWFYGRSNWCPGREVPVIRVDITEDVVAGESAELTYQAYGPDGEAFDRGEQWADIVLSSWVVTYR